MKNLYQNYLICMVNIIIYLKAPSKKSLKISVEDQRAEKFNRRDCSRVIIDFIRASVNEVHKIFITRCSEIVDMSETTK